jgi:phage-related minor tail protein
MANTQINLSQTNIQATVNMIVVMQGAKKLDAELKGIRGKVAAFKKSMEDSGLKPLDLSGFISGGGLLKPFQDGIKKAIAAQDELAKKASRLKGLKVPKVILGETSANLARFNKALDDISLKVGQALLPALNSIVTALTPVMTSIGQFMANNPYLVEGLGAAAVAFTVVTVAAMGLATVMGILTSPIGAIAAVVAAVVTVLVIGTRLIMDNWKPISGFFSDLGQDIASKTDAAFVWIRKLFGWKPGEVVKKYWDEAGGAMSGAIERAAAFTRESLDDVKSAFFDAGNSVTTTVAQWLGELKSYFDWSPKAQIDKAMSSVVGLYTDVVNRISAQLNGGLETIRSAFSWSPKALIEENWQPVAGVFAALWDVILATSAWMADFLKGWFGWSAQERVRACWDGVESYFAGLWESLTGPLQGVRDLFQSLFGWSPKDQFTENWEPLLGWFSGLSAKLQAVIEPIRALLDGNLSGFVATITGHVDSVTEQNGKPGADGENGLAPSFFRRSIQSMSDTSVSPGNLPQNASALIQQSAANNRTQLEGGLTVRFENAPAGLRTDQPQTNQPAFALSSRIGYRSLSLGGSNELA